MSEEQETANPILTAFSEVFGKLGEDQSSQNELILSLSKVIQGEEDAKTSLEKFCKEKGIEVPNTDELPSSESTSFLGKLLAKITAPFKWIKKQWDRLKDFYKKWYGKVVIFGVLLIVIGLLVVLLL